MAGEIRRCERLPLAVKFLIGAKGYEDARASLSKPPKPKARYFSKYSLTNITVA
jgi:hypothetical protein